MIKKVIFFSIVLFFLQSCASFWWWQKTVDIATQDISESREFVKIFSLWDSLTAWYWLPLEDSYPSQLQEKLRSSWYTVDVINGWVSWNTSSELKARLDWVLTDARIWDIAILVIWWNDGLRWMSLEDLENNIKEIIDLLWARNMTVVLWGMQIPPNLWLRYTRDFEALYKKIADTTPWVYFIDFFLDGVAGVDSLNLPDGIHPTRAWYEIIAQNVHDFLISNNILWSK